MDYKQKTREELIIELNELQQQYDSLKLSFETDKEVRNSNEAALIGSCEMLKTIEKAARIGGWEFNVETMVQTWTEETFRILEIDLTHGAPKVPEGIGFIAPEYQPMALLGIQRAIEFGEPYNQEWEVITAKGNRRWVNAIATPHQVNGKTKYVSGSFQDITERKEAEEASRKSEERFRSLLNNLEAGIVVHAPDTSIVMNNHRASELLGLSDEQMRGKAAIDPAWNFLHEDNTPLRLAEYPVNRIVTFKEPIKNQILGIHQPGKKDVVWVTVNGFPVLNNNGEITEIVISFIDITGRKKAEEALQASKEQFQSIFNNLQDAFFQANLSGNLILVSPSAVRLYGYDSAEEMIGMPAINFYHDEVERVKLIKELSDKGGIRDFIGQGKRKDGSTFWASMNIQLLYQNGEVSGTEGVVRDITDRKLADERLRLSEERYRFALEVTGQIGWSTPPDGVVEDMPMWRQYSGQSLEEVVGWKWLDAVHPDDRKSAFTAWSSAAAEKCNYFTEYRIRRADGVYRDFMVRGIPLLNGDGSCKEWVGTCIDITERKQAELLIQRKSEEIEAQNEELQQINEELNQTNQELAEAKKIVENSEARLKMALEVSKSGAWDWDILKNTFYWSDEFLHLFGLPEDTIPGFEAWTKALHPDDIEMASIKIREAIENHTELLSDYRIILPNNEIRWIRATGLITYVKKQPVRMIGMCMDITNQKTSEHELLVAKERAEESERLLSKIAENYPNSFVSVIEKDLTVGFSGGQEFKRQNLNPNDFAGLTLEQVFGEFSDIVKENYLKTFIGQETSFELFINNQYQLYKTVPLYDEENQITRILSVVENITERRQLDDLHSFLNTSGYPGSDRNFFESLAKYLAAILDSEYVCIDKLEGDGLTAQTVAVYNEGKFEPNVSYTLKQTPCGDVVGKTICCFPENVCQLFPHDEALQDLKAHSYIGTTLWSFNGKPIGLIAVIGQKPLKNVAFAENVLKLVAIRAAGELERLQVEEGLKIAKLKTEESEEFFRSIFENSPVGKSITGLDGSLKTNRAFSDMLGYSHQEFQTKSFKDITHPDDIQKSLDAVETLLKGEESVIHFEKKYIHRNGSVVFSEVVTTLQKNSDGKPLFFITSVNNITERKQSEKALKESEERFKNMFDRHSSIMLLVEPESGMITGANDASARFYGYSKAELLTMRIDQINMLSPEQVKMEREHAAREERTYFVFPHRLASGEVRTVEVHSSPIDFQDQRILFSIIHDITERKKAELELQLAREIADVNTANITAIIEGTSNSIWAFNRNYEIIYINHVFQQEFYQNFGVLLKPGISLLNSIPEAIRPFWKNRYDRVLNNEQFTDEEAIDTGNGIIYIQVTFNPIVKKGQVIGGSCFGSNITSRKLEEIELIKAKERAEESDRLKSAFLANMSHEIRTPMNGILGFADLLREQNLSGTEQQEYIGIIQKSGTRMLNIINDIIDISKIEAGLMKIDIRESNINEQIEYIYTFFKPEVEAKGMKLTFRNTLPSREAIIQTDREKIFAILTNLVKNAIKYSDKGTIEIGYVLESVIEVGEHRKVGERSRTPKLQFYIKDSGIGIPKDRQEAIFERFVQADIEDKKAQQGAGLGLAITKSYVEMLGGKIWVVSDEGKGSTFYFTLPYNPPRVEKVIVKKTISSQDAGDLINSANAGLKILIAEDDETSEILISLMVKMFGKEILKVRTGLAAIEACRNNPGIDIILMDIRMPEMGGYEATRQIRQFNKDVFIIAQTAYGLAGDRDKAIEAGCNEYISKPINKNDLVAMIQKHFNK